MCDKFLNAKFLKLSSYWKYEMTFSGIYDNKEFFVSVYTYNTQVHDLPLNKKVSINDLSECAYIKIKSHDISIAKNCNDNNDNYNNADILELKNDVFVPTLFDDGHVSFNSINKEIIKYLEYRADLKLKYYSLEEVNKFYYIDFI